jgi:calmodulin
MALTGATVDADEMMWRLIVLMKKKRMRSSDLFKKIDEDDSGAVTGDELKVALEGLGFKATEEEFVALMGQLDKDGGGDVSLKEFDRALRAREKQGPPKKKEEAGAVVKKGPRQGLSSEDKEEFRQIFCLFKQLCRQRNNEGQGNVDMVEWDDSGSISVDELEMLLETVGLHLDPAELDAMVREVDLDGSGDIDFNEFCETMTKKIQVEYSPEQINKSFKAFARQAPDGMIRVTDLRNALKTYMHKDGLVDAEVDSLLLHYKDCFVRPLGSDQDYFNYQDYIDLMAPIADRVTADTPAQ